MYYARNKRRVLPLVLVLALAVSVMVVVQSLIASARDSAFATYAVYNRVEIVAPKVQSHTDSLAPITAAAAGLGKDQEALTAGGLTDGTAASGQASLLASLQALPAEVQRAVPSTTALKDGLVTTAHDSRSLQVTLDSLAVRLRRAQKRQQQEAQVAQAVAEARRTNDAQGLLAFAQAQPQLISELAQPDTANYELMAADAQRSGVLAGQLAKDLDQVQGSVKDLSATAPKIPSLDKVVPQLTTATAAVKGLGQRLTELQAQLGTLQNGTTGLDDLQAQVKALPGMARVEKITFSNINLNLLAGNAAFDLFGLSDRGMQSMLDLYGDHVAVGRLPHQDAAEVAIAEEVARARGIGIGSMVGSDIDELDQLPEHFKVVGLIRGPVELGLLPYQHMVDSYFSARRYQALLVTPTAAALASSRAPLHGIVDKQPFRIFDEPFITGKINSLLANLDRLNQFMDLTVGLTMALVVALLNNIYLRQRMNEFGLLAAMGYPRRGMMRRVAVEGLVMVLIATVLGALAGSALLSVFSSVYMHPHGLRLRIFDPGILGTAALPVPVMVLLASTATLLRQLSRLDPIAVIERRD